MNIPISKEDLLRVEKPARYTGGELHAVKKENPVCRAVLSYPDLYEIGMANHGIQILYSEGNKVEDVSCERVFAAAPDFQKLLVEKGVKLYTLESYTPLNKCDLISFNLSHEMLYTNVLQILDLGGVPLRVSERGEDDPIVIAGGETTSNPAPLSECIDLFFIGDGEEGFPEILKMLVTMKKISSSREKKISALMKINGVYRHRHSENVKKIAYRNMPLDPVKPVIPSMRVSQDRGVVEITRGCFNLCKFCHAGYYELPCKHFDPALVAQKARDLIKYTGYNEITLLSLSAGDYGSMTTLLNDLLPSFNEQGVSLSLPSLKIDLKAIPIIEAVSGVRKTSLTFAVEAGSEEIRKKIHKNLTIDDLEQIAGSVFGNKFDSIKLYFMIGLPGYQERDEAEDILDLLFKIDTIGKKRKKINVTISPFIPKPHTPFEREEMAGEEYLKEIVFKLKREVPRRISIKNHSISNALLEGILARGDEKLYSVIEKAYHSGAVLDSWDEHFRPDLWNAAFAECGIEKQPYYRKRESDEILPWRKISTGFERITNHMKKTDTFLPKPPKEYSVMLDKSKIDEGFELFKKRYSVVATYRLTFTKERSAVFISHLDFIEIIKRGLRIMNAPVSYSQGFNKHERIAAGFPLQLGVESRAEILDVDVWADFDFTEFMHSEEIFPDGIVLQRFRKLEENDCGSIMSHISAIEYRIDSENTEILNEIKSFLEAKNPLVKTDKNGAEKSLSFESVVLSWGMDTGITLALTSTGGIKIFDFMKQAMPSNKYTESVRIIKSAQLTKDGELFKEFV